MILFLALSVKQAEHITLESLKIFSSSFHWIHMHKTKTILSYYRDFSISWTTTMLSVLSIIQELGWQKSQGKVYRNGNREMLDTLGLNNVSFDR